MINVNISGTVKFFDQKKGFGIITTTKGDVFIHATKTDDRQEELVPDAEVRIDFETQYKEGQYKHFATSLISVKAPMMPVEVLDVFKFYDPKKGYGFLLCPDAGLSKGEAFTSWRVAKNAGITPGEGMPARAMVVEKSGKVEVVSFEWGPEVEAAYAAKMKELHADDLTIEEDELVAQHIADTKSDLGQPDFKVSPKKAAPKKSAAKKTTPKRKSAPKKKPVTKAKSAPEATDVSACVETAIAEGASGPLAGALALACGREHSTMQ